MISNDLIKCDDYSNCASNSKLIRKSTPFTIKRQKIGLSNLHTELPVFHVKLNDRRKCCKKRKQRYEKCGCEIILYNK